MSEMMEIGSHSAHARDAPVATVACYAQAFRGMLVRLEGWITLEFENIAIYPSAESVLEWCCSSKGSRGSFKGLWLDADRMDGLPGGVGSLWKMLKKDGKSLSGPGVVEGIVDPGRKGHLGAWPAALNPLHRLVLGTSKDRWPDFDWEALEARTERTRVEERRRRIAVAEGFLAGCINVVDAARGITEPTLFSCDDLRASDAELLERIEDAGVSIPPPHARLNCSAEFLARIAIQVEAIDARYGDDLRALCFRLVAAKDGL